MAKTLYLICNAHLDPVWQWEWEEGAAEAISTFRVAADFCEERDGFVFCHNEALLYQWIEEYEPELFQRIVALVKKGSWHIMGGWHLQPDCNMPSGEALTRNILAGRTYFLQKFGVAPEVAVNVDPFGHSRGLVQILTKSGYNGYLFMRPDSTPTELEWVGVDGSRVLAVRLRGGYNSRKGQAESKIRSMIDACPEDDFALCLWGIGNHGGGPSRKDLDDIAAMQKANPNEILIHSTPEAYLDKVRHTRTLPEVKDGLNAWAVGCYTSQIRVKQAYRRAENEYFAVESMCAIAPIAYPQAELESALWDILTAQFHDMLPGTDIQPAEESTLRLLDHALEILSRVRARAFFALCAGQKKAPEDRIPILAYNPYPYPLTGDFACEFMLWDQGWGKEFFAPTVYDEAGNALKTQCEKEYSTIPLQWRKRVVFRATLKPMCVSRFDCGFTLLDGRPVPDCEKTDEAYWFVRGGFRIGISRQTGLPVLWEQDGKSVFARDACRIDVFEDNYDPWYMQKNRWDENIGAFTLLTPEETQEYLALSEPLEPVHVIEQGDVRTVVEAVFGYRNSRAVVKYDLSDSLRIDIRLDWHEKQKRAVLHVPAAFAPTERFGEQPYAVVKMNDTGDEDVSHRFIALANETDALGVINDGVYGSSFDRTSGVLYITLLRSPAYCAHPIDGRVTMPQDRYCAHIDQGERDYRFDFRFGIKETVMNTLPREAMHVNRQPMLLSFYPQGQGEKPVSSLTLTDTDVILFEALKPAENGDGQILRLFNPTERPQTATLNFEEHTYSLSFAPFEIKTLRLHGGTAEETDLTEGLLNER